MVNMQIRRFPELDYRTNEAVNTLCTNLFYAGENFKRIMFTSCRLRRERASS